MKFMNCTSCQGLVQVNATGICLGCQRGFVNTAQEDAYLFHQPKEEIYDANEITSPTKVDACHQTRDGKEVGGTHCEGKTTSKKSKKEK